MAADTMGINTALYKSLTFGVSAMYTGIAGALGAIAIQFVAPDGFNILLSITLLGIGLVNATLASSEKGFFAMGFLMSLFAAVAVQKNVRDIALADTSDRGMNTVKE